MLHAKTESYYASLAVVVCPTVGLEINTSEDRQFSNGTLYIPNKQALLKTKLERQQRSHRHRARRAPRYGFC